MRPSLILAASLCATILSAGAPSDLAVAGTPTVAADAAAVAKRADIKKLLAIMEVTKNQITVMKKMLNAQKAANPMVTQAFVDAFLAETTPEKLEEVFLPVYEKNLSAAEVKALLAFYATPEGASFVKKQGIILDESMEAGQRMGMEIGMKVMQKLQAEEAAPASSPASSPATGPTASGK